MKVFPPKHPYLPMGCGDCELRLAKGDSDCSACYAIKNNLSIIEKSNKKPPRLDTYYEKSKGLYISEYKGESELGENERLANIVINHLKVDVYILPLLDPKNKKLKALRPILLPEGVFDNKNPDFMINGLLFDGKSMMKIKKTNRKGFKGKLENRIKSAKEQADNMIIEVPKWAKRKWIDDTVNNYLDRSHKDRTIYIIHKNKIYVYKKTTA